MLSLYLLLTMCGTTDRGEAECAIFLPTGQGAHALLWIWRATASTRRQSLRKPFAADLTPCNLAQSSCCLHPCVALRLEHCCMQSISQKNVFKLPPGLACSNSSTTKEAWATNHLVNVRLDRYLRNRWAACRIPLDHDNFKPVLKEKVMSKLDLWAVSTPRLACHPLVPGGLYWAYLMDLWELV